ncbi:MAG: hypothetical protein ACLSHG_09395 [Oscillospiraceae bacterium]
MFLALYALGILAAAVAARLLGRTALRGEAASFVMELPDYRWPNARSVLRRMWVRTREFLTRAFTVILAASVGVWVLRTFTPTWRVAANAGESLLAVVGQAARAGVRAAGLRRLARRDRARDRAAGQETVLSTLGVLLGGDLTAALPGVFSQPRRQATSCSRRCTRRVWRRRRPCGRSLAAGSARWPRRPGRAPRHGARRRSFTASPS